MMAKKKTLKQRNPVVRKMIQYSQKAGLHIDQKKEASRCACRNDIDDLIDEWYEYGGDEPIYEYLGMTKEEYIRYVMTDEFSE